MTKTSPGKVAGNPECHQGMGIESGMKYTGKDLPAVPVVTVAQGTIPAHWAAMCSRKRKMLSDTDEQEPDPILRCRLHDAYTHILNRPLQPGDIVYNVSDSGQGQVAEIRLPSLPGALGMQSWTSKPCANRRLARVHAAGKALTCILSDPELAASVGPGAGQSSIGPTECRKEGSCGLEGTGSHSDLSRKGEQDGAVVEFDFKAQVVMFCQWSCGRPMRKKDIVYTVARHYSWYQATVTLSCFSGEEFTGTPRTDRRQAEHAAAEVMLKAFERERAQMDLEMNKKRRVQTDGTSSGADPSVKMKLHEACSRILRRPPQTGDVVYEVAAWNGGPRAALRLPSVPGQLGMRIWESRACASRRDARIQVAGMALEAIRQDPTFGPLLP